MGIDKSGLCFRTIGWVSNQRTSILIGPDAGVWRWVQIPGTSKFRESLCSIPSAWIGYCKWKTRAHFYQLIVHSENCLTLVDLNFSFLKQVYLWSSLTKQGQPRLHGVSSGLYSAKSKHKPNLWGTNLSLVFKSYRIFCKEESVVVPAFGMEWILETMPGKETFWRCDFLSHGWNPSRQGLRSGMALLRCWPFVSVRLYLKACDQPFPHSWAVEIPFLVTEKQLTSQIWALLNYPCF